MKLKSKIPQDSIFAYREPPVSGNVLNGLGETEPRRASYVFHSNAKTGPLPWDRMQTMFRHSYPVSMLPAVLRNMWAAFRPQGSIAPEKKAVTDLPAMTTELKAKAISLGAGIVGICEIKPDYLIEGETSSYKYAVVLGLPMDREVMLHATSVKASREVSRVYNQCSRLTVDIARHIRTLGWRAQGLPVNSSGEYLHIPMAIAAGLGELGKHGSLISREYGSNVRLTTVLTDLPLSVDEPIDIGVEDLCAQCQLCTKACPPGAISDEKQMVRGTRKWYVDFDRCVPYFSDTYGCAICLEMCPWSKPGRGPGLAEKLLKVRARRSADQSN
jgi:epoxyqueuosine reductase